MNKNLLKQYARLIVKTGANVQVGQPVVMGQVIARVGSTGRSTANHVHFEVMPDGYTPTNPYNYVVQ